MKWNYSSTESIYLRSVYQYQDATFFCSFSLHFNELLFSFHIVYGCSIFDTHKHTHTFNKCSLGIHIILKCFCLLLARTDENPIRLRRSLDGYFIVPNALPLVLAAASGVALVAHVNPFRLKLMFSLPCYLMFPTTTLECSIFRRDSNISSMKTTFCLIKISLELAHWSFVMCHDVDFLCIKLFFMVRWMMNELELSRINLKDRHLLYLPNSTSMQRSNGLLLTVQICSV